MLIPRRRAHTYEGEWGDIAAYAAGDLPLADDLVTQWEQAVANYVGAPQAAAIGSGRQGMRMILSHLGVGEGDDVVVPAYTLAALLPVIQSLGASIVCAEVDLRTMNVTPDTVRAALTGRTRAVLVLHAFGAPAPVAGIAEVCNDRGVALVEDCAHALGATHDGTHVGTFGYAGFYSFEPTKPVNTYGGGIVVSRDETLIARIRQRNAAQPENLAGVLAKSSTVQREQALFRSGLAFPILASLSMPVLRGPVNRLYRSRQGVPPGDACYSRLQAHLGLRKLASLEERIAQRAAMVDMYRTLLSPELPTQRVTRQQRSTWYFLATTLPHPAKNTRAALLWRGVDAAVEEEVMDDCATLYEQPGCPHARILFKRNLVLPLYDSMVESDVRSVVQRLRQQLRLPEAD